MTTTPNQPDRERAIAMIDGHPEDGGGIRPSVSYADHSYPAYSRRQMIDFALAFRDADRAGEGEERAATVTWLRHQSDLGANRGNEADKGTTKRAAFGGGSLALHRAADAIEAGEHRTNDNAALSTPATPLLDDETVERN